MSKKVTTKPGISDHEKEIPEQLSKIRLKPSIKLYTVSAGATFVYVEVTWTTLLIEGSLKVIYHVDRDIDISSQFTIDEAAMKAYATVDTKSVGIVEFKANGEFLAVLVPIRTIDLHASSMCYIPY